MEIEKGIHSEEILKTIVKNLKLFLAVFLILTVSTAIKIGTMPVQYKAQAFFRYMGLEPERVTIKEDNNGTITLKHYELGEDNLDIFTISKGREFTDLKEGSDTRLRFDSGNGNFSVESIADSPTRAVEIANSYVALIRKKNREFLEKKLESERDLKLREKIEYELENEDRSFPVVIEAEKAEKIDRKIGMLLSFGVMLSLLISILLVFIWEAVREVAKRR